MTTLPPASRPPGSVSAPFAPPVRATSPQRKAQWQEIALNTLTHDIRSPLNSISIQLDLLDASFAGPLTPLQREALMRIRTGMTEINELATLVADACRALADEPAAEIALVADCVQSCVKQLEARACAKALSLEVDVAPGLLVEADARWFKRIIGNLLDNAVKYTPAGGHIRITGQTLADDRSILLTIADDGPGVLLSDAAQIFEPYARAAGTARTVEGLGLGLSLARALANRMRGELRLEPASAVGARFVLQMPGACAG